MTSTKSAVCYVFGVVPADAPAPRCDVDASMTSIRLVGCDDVAAVVGSVPADRPLGRAADLVAHDRVLADLIAAGTPVLPFRFGAVVTDEQAVIDELLAPHRDDFAQSLATVRGRVQYTVRASYEQDAVLPEVLAQHPEIDVQDGSEEASFAQKVRLGEQIVTALADLRPGDAASLFAPIARHAADVRTHEPGAADEVLHAAFLVETDRAAEFERAVESVGETAAGRIRIRLVGPVAAYDFVEEP